MGEEVVPPGNAPLVEGLGSEWNDFVSAFPEDKRGELGSKLKERISSYEPLKQYEDFHKSGVAPEQISNALNLYSIVENNPRQVYDLIGQSLGITPQQAKELVEDEIEENEEEDPRFAKLSSLEKQVETMAAIMLAQNQQEQQSAAQQEADKQLETELSGLRKKFGDFDEEQVVMRMLHKGLSAEQAYQEYTQYEAKVRERRPAPMLMGGGGTVPNRAIDPTKLNTSDTKALVAQMMAHGNAQNKQ